MSAPVVHLDRFYHYRLSDRTDVLDAREFLLEFSQPKEEEQFVANPSQRRTQIGDYAALMAMHAFPADPMGGTRSNCQNCHAKAATPAFENGPAHSANYGRIFNEGYLSPTSDYYRGLVRTDFLWLVVFHSRVQTQKKK